MGDSNEGSEMAVDRGVLARGRSLVLYVVHYTLFKDARHIFLWSLTSLAFLPISVLFVTLIIIRLLMGRAQKARMQKMNMVIGAFFSEVGNELLALLAAWDEDVEALRPLLRIRTEWQEEDFGVAVRRLARHSYTVGTERIDLSEGDLRLQKNSSAQASGEPEPPRTRGVHGASSCRPPCGGGARLPRVTRRLAGDRPETCGR